MIYLKNLFHKTYVYIIIYQILKFYEKKVYEV